MEICFYNNINFLYSFFASQLTKNIKKKLKKYNTKYLHYLFGIEVLFVEQQLVVAVVFGVPELSVEAVYFVMAPASPEPEFAVVEVVAAK